MTTYTTEIMTTQIIYSDNKKWRPMDAINGTPRTASPTELSCVAGG
jgi:hypothetical protein